ncbi:hypothetical protein [Kitasatospora sp. NPDC057500]|uniref:hypothetical protein n=1 Tax=Kitasatospora sp. NPDC057500 TaxID=3346151 RepID=UPI0036CA4BD9
MLGTLPRRRLAVHAGVRAAGRPRALVIRTVRLDPLRMPTEHLPTGRCRRTWTWGLGLDEHADDVSLPLANVPGVTTAGSPGFGKTSLINKLICDLVVVIKELLGHAHIGVTATVHAHVRLRLQREAINTLSTALNGRAITQTANGDDDELLPCAALVR